MTTYKIAFSRMVPKTKIPQGDPLWKEFNGSFENMDVDAMEMANLIYTGHPFTTWHKDHWRHGRNYLLGQHLGIDFDTEDERSSITHLAKDKFVARYGTLVYTTPSHTPEAPRARAVFLLDQPIHQAVNYTRAAAALLWLFGTADRQCKDAARFFYGSINCDCEWFPDNVLPLETVKSLIKQYEATGRQAKRAHTELRPTPDQAEVAAALQRIPPWGIEYDEWVQVLMALHSAYGDAGKGLAEAWGQGANGEVARKWRSFRREGNGAGRITIATLFHIAERFGWSKTA